MHSRRRLYTSRAIDSSHVAMLIGSLLKEYFTEWKISAPCVFNTQVGDFLKIIRRANANDIMKMAYSGKAKDTAAKFIEINMNNGKSSR